MRRKGLLLALLAIATVSGFIGRYFVRSAIPPLAATPASSIEETAGSAEEAASPAEESTSSTKETIIPAEDPSPAEVDSSLDQENADGSTSATSGETPSVDLSAIEPSFVEPSASQPERLRLHIADAPAENSELAEPDIATTNQDDIADTNPDILASASPTSTANSSSDIAVDDNSDAPAGTNSGAPEVPLTGGVDSAEPVARWQDLTRATTLLLLGAIILLAATRWLFSGARK